MTDTIARPIRMRVPRPAPADAPATQVTRTIPMSTMSTHLPTGSTSSAGWVTFSYVSFAAAAGMTALGIWALPGDLWVKGYMMMAAVFLCGSTFTLAKTVRDEHEARRFANRLEEAKTEKLLMEMNRN
jgi:hypothetical protein